MIPFRLTHTQHDTTHICIRTKHLDTCITQYRPIHTHLCTHKTLTYTTQTRPPPLTPVYAQNTYIHNTDAPPTHTHSHLCTHKTLTYTCIHNTHTNKHLEKAMKERQNSTQESSCKTQCFYSHCLVLLMTHAVTTFTLVIASLTNKMHLSRSPYIYYYHDAPNYLLHFNL